MVKWSTISSTWVTSGERPRQRKGHDRHLVGAGRRRLHRHRRRPALGERRRPFLGTVSPHCRPWAASCVPSSQAGALWRGSASSTTAHLTPRA